MDEAGLVNYSEKWLLDALGEREGLLCVYVCVCVLGTEAHDLF